jgi:hypothetical protein
MVLAIFLLLLDGDRSMAWVLWHGNRKEIKTGRELF